MPHSHLAIRHLIRQLDLRGRSPSPHRPPAWLRELLHETAELFDPSVDEARAGFECRRSASGWEATLFLGSSEIVGGRDDGRVKPVGFRFDLQPLLAQFERVDAVNWIAFPESANEESDDRSFLTVSGVVRNEQLTLQICACPPASCGPAMRHYADGRYELC